MIKKCLPLIFLFLVGNLWSNGINVSNISFNSETNEISFTLQWENSWSYLNLEPDLTDAAWIFIKYAPNGGDNWYHAEILDSTPIVNYVQLISYDDLGLMVYKNDFATSGPFGPVTLTLELAPMTGGYQDFKVFATEMVFIDRGDFYAGDGVSPGRFYKDGNNTSPWFIENENAIMRGNGSGQFNQQGSSNVQDLSVDFPKGWDSFWCMKYKITAQQYMDFLNCLSRTQQNTRTKADLSGITASNKYVMTDSPSVQDRNPIACDVNIGTGAIEFYVDMDDTNPPNSPNDGANVVLNHLTPEDILAYFDWSGLRPMTELEYEKICRGQDVPPLAGEYAWGTDTYNAAGAISNGGTMSEATANVGILPSLFALQPLRAGYAATATSGRTESGGTFWGNMDIHNLGEFMYSVESINFSRTSYGDGQLNLTGNANVPSWITNSKVLSTQDLITPAISPISQGKTEIPQLTTRSAYVGARGVRRLYLN
jgi:formylglycine-generating enzyme required for sulfatase activity